jgi:glycosyltransferase involved in cell wall biosynthesis
MPPDSACAVSVIVCTHNPRQEYLTRVLAALRVQTLPTAGWELLVIDNASKEPVAGRFDLSWHPHGRHVREDELGLTPARLRWIAEARAELLVFVDDDNVLDPDYL